MVGIRGIDGPTFDRVTSYRDSLWWKPLDRPTPKDKDHQDPRLDPAVAGDFRAYFEQGLSLTAPSAPGAKGELKVTGPGRPALVLGSELGGYNDRVEDFLAPVVAPGDKVPFILRRPATLSVLPMDRGGRALPGEQKTIVIPVVNQFRSGLYEVDANTILIRLDALQKMLLMDEAERADNAGSGEMVVRRVDPKTGREYFVETQKLRTEPARVTNVLVRAKPGVDENALRDRCDEIYSDFARAHAGDVTPPPPPGAMRIITWRDRNKTLIDAVENETGVVLFIFGIISFTSVFLILAIFWSMVREKTRDIGILRAIGASRGGVAWIWIRYGLTIGIVGALLGGILAYLIVTNINPIHEAMGKYLHITIWNPKVYYFSTIPHEVEWPKAVIVMCSGALASIIGALIPAIKAANLDPVKSLRWE
jgi:lipoprotein-releasing system permease protein